WREQDRILIPLEPESRMGQAIPVEIFYSCKVGKSGKETLDWELFAPRFDLPLENITWKVSLSEKWKLQHWKGAMELTSDETRPGATETDLSDYLKREDALQQERTRQAEGFLAVGNSALQEGAPQLARRAFQSAYGLSSHDAAFNEDAR